jgi:hypothetical protein
MSEEKKIETVTESPQNETWSPQTETELPNTVTASPEPEKKQDVKVDPESEKRQGIKEGVANSEAMAIEKANAENKPVEKQTLPSYFVKKSDRHRVEVDILSSRKDGKIMSISRTGLGLDFANDFSYLRHDVMWFEFSVPNYEDMTTYRQRAAVWRREAQQLIIDKLQLRHFLLVWHLKDWSLTDETGAKVELKFDDNGALSDESLAKVYAVMPTLLDVVLTIFEKDILLI